MTVHIYCLALVRSIFANCVQEGINDHFEKQLLTSNPLNSVLDYMSIFSFS